MQDCKFLFLIFLFEIIKHDRNLAVVVGQSLQKLTNDEFLREEEKPLWF